MLSDRAVPGYVDLVGPEADAVTFFVGSLLFTAGGAMQTWLAFPERGAALWAAAIQSAGTLFFNATTFRALDTALSNPDYDALVWRPDALGSVCFLVSGVIAYRAPRAGLAAAGQPARVHLLRDLGRRRLRRARERVDDRPGGGELEHGARGRMLPRLRRERLDAFTSRARRRP